MSYSATVIKVMIASPSDVFNERNIIREIMAEWNSINADKRKIVLLPVGWETHSTPAMGDRPQAIINKQILDDCDLLVGVFWTRVGTSTGEYDSGTIEEIEEHMKNDKPTMIYFSNAPVRPDSVNEEQYSKLKSFKDSCQQRGLYEEYNDPNEFKDKFNRHLQLQLNNDETFSPTIENDKPVIYETTIPNSPSLSQEAQTLLKEAAQSSDGSILKLRYLGGMEIQTNGKNFIDNSNPRTTAIWEDAINQLVSENLIEDRGYKGEVYKVTRNGYEIADLLK